MRNKESISQDIIIDIQEKLPQITNMKSGGVLRTFIEVVGKFISYIYEELDTLLPNLFSHSASDKWLDNHALELNILRHPAQKTMGKIILKRLDNSNNITIPAGKIFSTKLDNKGKRYRFINTKEYIFESGNTELEIEIKAEESGSNYNVPQNSITEIITPISGIDSVHNNEIWITQLGTNIETDNSLRERCLNQWKGLNGANKDAYIYWAKSIPGIEVAIPRSSSSLEKLGIIEIYILGEKNTFPEEEVINKVREKIEYNKPIGTEIKIKTPRKEKISINIEINLHRNSEIVSDQEYMILFLKKIKDFFQRIAIGYDFEPSELSSKLFELKIVKSIKITPSYSVLIDPWSLAVLDEENLIINII